MATKQIWTDRQVMLEGSHFEFYHYLDEVPPKVEFHQHPFFELFLFLNGDVDYIIEGKTYRLRPGDILLTSSLDIHRPEIRPGKPYERIVIWLENDFFSQIPTDGDALVSCFADAARMDYRRVRPSQPSQIHIRKLCAQISETQNKSEPGSPTLTYAYLLELLVEVCRCYFNISSGDEKDDITEDARINEIIHYINAHIRSDLSLDSIAGAFYVSKYYLTRQFKRFVGISLYQYIIKKRLTISRDMLLAGVPVTSACMECGFGDYSTYLKAFKREFGRNPSDFLPHRT